MSDKEESSSAHLPVEGVVGITVGLVLFLLMIMLYMYCRLYARQKRNSVIMDGNQVARRLETNQSTKRNVKNVSYRKSDDSMRPTSGDSKHSFRFDASAMKARNQDGRISYDRPYSQQFIPGIVEESVFSEIEQTQQNKDSTSTEPVPALVSNYGQVAMVSTGMYYDNHTVVGPPHLVASADSLIGQTNSHTNLITQAGNESPVAVSHRQVLSQDGQSYVVYAEPHKQPPNRLSHVIYAHPHIVKPSPDRQSHMLYVDPQTQHDSKDNRIRGGGEPQCRTDRAPMEIPKHYIAADPRRQQNCKPRPHNVSEDRDSFRDSQGLDLGADPNKAWKIFDQIN